MTAHVLKDDLILLRKGELKPGEILAVVSHLETCPECAAAAADTVDASAAAESWSNTLQSALRDHLRGDELLDYVDGRLSPAGMSEAGAHLELCTVCRDDVADLRRSSGNRVRFWKRIMLSAAATIVVVAGLGLLLRRPPTKNPVEPSRPPVVTTTTVHPPTVVMPAEWRALVAAAVENERIAPPALLATLRMPGEATRGEGMQRASAVAPDGVVIDDPRPHFRWEGSPGAVYTVSVFAGDREAARSAALRKASWVPERDLDRGQTYRWQVEARRGNETWIIPAVPQPAPRFRLLDDAGHQDLESARCRYPDDHLLLGVLAAHYGLQGEAIAELTLDREAQSRPALLDSVKAWGQR